MKRDELLARGEEIPTVAYALDVFRAASIQAPLVYPAEPIVTFSTTANGNHYSWCGKARHR